MPPTWTTDTLFSLLYVHLAYTNVWNVFSVWYLFLHKAYHCQYQTINCSDLSPLRPSSTSSISIQNHWKKALLSLTITIMMSNLLKCANVDTSSFKLTHPKLTTTGFLLSYSISSIPHLIPLLSLVSCSRAGARTVWRNITLPPK